MTISLEMLVAATIFFFELIKIYFSVAQISLHFVVLVYRYLRDIQPTFGEGYTIQNILA